MVDSGLGEILSSTFASAPMKLLGEQFPQNVRVLQILVEELLHPESEKKKLIYLMYYTRFQRILKHDRLFDRTPLSDDAVFEV